MGWSAVLLWGIACGGRGGDGPEEPPVAEPAPVEPAPLIQPSQGLAADLQAANAFTASRPLYEQPLGSGLDPIPGVPSLSARACGACHAELYAEWKTSTHAHAWVDPQFQAEITKSGNRWLCLNCHTPLRVQQDLWPVGLQGDDVELPILVEAPVYDAALREEGITCAACHVRQGEIWGPGLSDSRAPHPVRASEAYRTNEVCERCHQALATYEGKDFVCTFDTGGEWAAGPYPAEGKGCSDCHMPMVERPAAAGGPAREVRQHWWRGAGIPKAPGVEQPVEANPPGLDLAAKWAEDRLTVVMTNAGAGHRLPTGDPERWVQVDVHFVDAQGAAIGDPWSHRIGQTWTWWPAPEKTGDNRLAPRESRSESVVVPDGAAAARLVASSHRMTAAIAEYHHLGDYPRQVVTHRLRVDAAGSQPDHGTPLAPVPREHEAD